MKPDRGLVHYERMVGALGGHSDPVERAADVRPAIERALSSDQPACVHVMVDPRPQSPGLEVFMLMEVMPGKQPPCDRSPASMRTLRSMGLYRVAREATRRYVDRVGHKDMWAL